MRAGDGGRGAVSFRRERYVPRGGPDGGDGGAGGSVYVVADGRLRTLNHLVGVSVVAAEKGKDGGGAKKTGRAGHDREIRVPLGTEVRGEAGVPAGELVRPGDRLAVARGGRGGRGNVHFATATARTPRYAEKGAEGEKRRVRLTLKLIADAALIGPPNAGKSSLLAALSAARPKIAAYPFTTLAPQLGIVEVSPAEAFAVVEVPGLVEGAAAGRGLGHDFLRHVERARFLVVVVDVAAPDPRGDLSTVLRELAVYDRELAGKIRLVVANKTDLAHDPATVAGLKKAADVPVAAVSALTGDGVSRFKETLARIALRHDNTRS